MMRDSQINTHISPILLSLLRVCRAHNMEPRHHQRNPLSVSRPFDPACSITQIDRLLRALSIALVACPLAEYLDVIIWGLTRVRSTFNAHLTFNVLNDF